MTLYHIEDNELIALESASLSAEGIYERDDLQRMLRDQIEAIVPDTYVIAEEFTNWEDSSRRVDLLCLDHNANLVVVELKRGVKGGHMDLQAIRYAAMIAPMTFEQLIEAHMLYLNQRDEPPEDAESRILDFLGWDEPDEQAFGGDVRIVLVAADFSTELTSAVLWLNERQMDIRCVRLSPHKLDDRLVFAIEQCIPIPEAQDYQVRIKNKAQTGLFHNVGARTNCFESIRFQTT